MESIHKDALDKAHVLAGAYGGKLERPIVYTQGVALTARLELAALDTSYPDPTPEIDSIVAPYLDDQQGIFTDEDGTANYAGISWTSEMSRDPRCANLLVKVADRFMIAGSHGMPEPLDRDFRVEDMFFAGTILQRASGITGDSRYVGIAAEFVAQCAEKLMQPSGIYWHCLSSPYFWGRGNGFATLGFAETLKGLKNEKHDELADLHIKHLKGLRKCQDSSSGMWRQVIDRNDTYLEMSATCMIGISIAIGITNGWLEKDEWASSLESAWRGVSQGIDSEGRVTAVCVGTGPLASLGEYVIRDSVTGFDDRGGAMALWFAIEVARVFQ